MTNEKYIHVQKIHTTRKEAPSSTAFSFTSRSGGTEMNTVYGL